MPHYTIDAHTEKIVHALVEKCEQLGLENVSFVVYPTPDNKGAELDMAKNMYGWELAVSSDAFMDFYRIRGGELILIFSHAE